MSTGNTFTKVRLYGLGGRWAVATAICTDSYGVSKIRVAKGKAVGIKAPPKGTTTELEGTFEQMPITQPNKLNIKRASEWHAIQDAVEPLLLLLEVPEEDDATE